MAERVPASLISALTDLVGWLEAISVPTMAGTSMIIGGVAASLLGRPRLTQDIDALVLLDEALWDKAVVQAKMFGIAPRIDSALDFARHARVLLLRHSASLIDIDVSFGGLSFEFEAIKRSSTHDIAGVGVRLPSVEDLIVMKAVAHRPKDLQDIEGLLAAHPNADLTNVRKWLGEFANAMTMPDLLEDFEKIVTRQTRR